MSPTEQHPKLEWFARAGYGARGVVYVMVGWLALSAAWETGRARDTESALRTLIDEPFGQALLAVIAAGLVAFAGWRLVQALRDVDNHGTDGKGMAIRAGLFGSAVSYLLLAVFAVSLITGWGAGGGSGGDSKQEWTAQLLAMRFGKWLVGTVGAIIVIIGLAHGYKAYKARYKKYFDMDRETMKRTAPICRFGLVARGVVFVIIGGFVLLAAIRSDPSEARGLSGALSSLQDQPFGWVLMGVVALGLIAFGLYSLIEAVYRRVGRDPGAASGPS